MPSKPPKSQAKRVDPMSKALSPSRQSYMRDLIDARKIVQRLQAFTLSETDAKGEVVTMSRDQVSAAVALLRKCLPDQAAVVHSGDPTNPIATSLTISFKRPEPLTIAAEPAKAELGAPAHRVIDVDPEPAT